MGWKKKSHLLLITLTTIFTIFQTNAASSQEVLRVTTWGGSYLASYQQSIHEFEEANNVRIEWVVGSTSDFMVKARLGQVDVVTNDLTHSIDGEAESLWLKLDANLIPNLKNLYDRANHSPYTVYTNVGEYALVYNSDFINTVPDTWDVLWEKSNKNKVAIYSFDDPGPLGLMLQQAEKEGGSIDNVRPGLARMVELNKQAKFIDVETQIVSLFELEEVWVGMLTNGRVRDLWNKGKTSIKIARPKEGAHPLISTINVSKSTKNAALAMKFVNHVLGKKNQEVFAINNLYAPTVNDAVISDDFEFKSLLITEDDFEKLYLPDSIKIRQMKNNWSRLFNRMSTP